MCPPHLPKRPSTPLNLGTVKHAVDTLRDDIDAEYQQITEELDIIEDQLPSLAETGVLVEPERPEAETYGSSPVTNAETLLYQVKLVKGSVEALETHLSEGCRILTKRCECCQKHASKLENFSTETIPIAARSGQSPQIYGEMAQWARHLQTIPLESSDEVFYAQSGVASAFAKRLRAMEKELEQKV